SNQPIKSSPFLKNNLQVTDMLPFCVISVCKCEILRFLRKFSSGKDYVFQLQIRLLGASFSDNATIYVENFHFCFLLSDFDLIYFTHSKKSSNVVFVFLFF